MPLAGKPMILQIIDRLNTCLSLQETIVATTLSSHDDPLCTVLERAGIRYYRGSESDVLQRFAEAAHLSKAELIVRITGDCPLIHPQLIDDTVNEYVKTPYDYLYPNSASGVIRGLDVEVFSREALEKANRIARKEEYREHVTACMYNEPDHFHGGVYIADKRLRTPKYRLCVDEETDYLLIKCLYEELYQEGKIIDIYEVLHYLQQNPEIASLNAEVRQRTV